VGDKGLVLGGQAFVLLTLFFNWLGFGKVF